MHEFVPTPTYRIGQIWKDRRNKPTRWVLITETYVRTYDNCETAIRVKYACIANDDEDGSFADSEECAEITHDEMDSRSVHKMFPFIMFDTPVRARLIVRGIR